MERRRRRLWTWLLTTVTSLVIAAALVVGVFRLAVLATPGYKADIADWVGEVLNRPVDIGNMDLTWRGFRPTLQFTDVALQGFSPASPALEFAELQLGFSIIDLARGRLLPSHIDVVGAVIEIIRQPDGSVRIRGLGEHRGGSLPRLDDRLAGLDAVRVRDASLMWHDQARNMQPQWLREVDLILARDGAAMTLALTGRAQASGARIQAQARLPENDFNDATASVQVDALQPGPWLDDWLGQRIAPMHLSGDPIELHADLRWQRDSDGDSDGDRDWLEINGQLHTGRLTHVATPRAIESLDTSFTASVADGRIDVALSDLRVVDQTGRWQADRVAMQSRQGDHGGQADFDASRLRLASLMVWVEPFLPTDRPAPAWLRATGELTELAGQVNWQTDAPPRYSVTAALTGGGLRQQGEAPAVSGLAGRLTVSEVGGHLALDADDLEVRLPDVFTDPLMLDTVRSTVSWQRRGDAWDLDFNGLHIAAHASRLDGAIGLRLGDAPQLDIDLGLASDDVTALKRFIPRPWHPNLRAWLSQAIVEGRVGSGRLRVAGPVDGVPYRDVDGMFRLELNISPGTLGIGNDWPHVEDLVAQLVMDRAELTVDAVSGRVMGVPIEPTVVHIADLKYPVLEIDGGARGPLTRMLEFVDASPLRKPLGVLNTALDADGLGQLVLDLDIPIKDIKASRFDGSLTVSGARLRVRGVDTAFRDVQGTVSFDNDGVRADDVKAVFRDAPIRASLRPERIDGELITHLTVNCPIRFDRADDPWARLLPQPLRQRLDGATQATATLQLRKQMPRELVIRSDLTGVTSSLPSPVSKPDAASVLPLTIFWPIHEGWPRTARVQLGERGALHLRSDAPEQLDALAIAVGADTQPNMPDTGTRIAGQVASADVPAWLHLGRQLATGRNDGTSGGPLVLDLQADRVTAGPVRAGAQTVRGTITPSGGDLSFTGAAEGSLRWRGTNQRKVSARLSQLVIERLERPPQATGESAAKPLDLPGDWPALNIVIDSLRVDDLDAGRLTVEATPREHGVQLDRLSLSGGELALDLSGYIAQPNDMTRAGLSGALTTPRIDKVMYAAGFVPNVRAESARVALDIGWPESPGGLALNQATGSMDLNFTDGALAAVDPGAGRVLGLFSFYALPRRLLLDFRDMTDAGLTFDAIDGRFRISGGQARTDNFKVSAPSVAIDVDGAVGLVTRTYDQTITVYPDVSSGVTLAGALLGGPAVGAIVMLAQELLDRPLNQATQLSYHLGGTWENPVITRREPRAAGETDDEAAGQGPRS